jgi:hypothetical protein
MHWNLVTWIQWYENYFGQYLMDFLCSLENLASCLISLFHSGLLYCKIHRGLRQTFISCCLFHNCLSWKYQAVTLAWTLHLYSAISLPSYLVYIISVPPLLKFCLAVTPLSNSVVHYNIRFSYDYVTISKEGGMYQFPVNSDFKMDVTMKDTAFRDMMSCCLVEGYGRFVGT